MYSEENPNHLNFVPHKSHIICLGIDTEAAAVGFLSMPLYSLRVKMSSLLRNFIYGKHHSALTGSGMQPAAHPMDTGGFLLGGKVGVES
jgi:hypothetical protein